MAVFYVYRGKFLEESSMDLLSTRDEAYGNCKTIFLDTGSCESLPQGIHGFEFLSGMNDLGILLLVYVFFDL